jgi:hypothetical protein
MMTVGLFQTHIKTTRRFLLLSSSHTPYSKVQKHNAILDDFACSGFQNCRLERWMGLALFHPSYKQCHHIQKITAPSSKMNTSDKECLFSSLFFSPPQQKHARTDQ